MNAMAHYEDADLALFAMQLLEEEDHRAVAEHVGGCAFCRQELARLQGDLATCAYGVEMYAPASKVRERVTHQVAREKRTPPVEEVTASLRVDTVAQGEKWEEPTLEFRRRSPAVAGTRRRKSAMEDEDEPRPRNNSGAAGIFVWLGWAAAAGLAVLGTGLYFQQKNDSARLATQAREVAQLRGDAAEAKRLLATMTDSSAQRVLLSAAAAAEGKKPAEGRVIYVASNGSLVLLTDHLAALDTDKVYELWLIPADGRDPMPAGTFRTDSRGSGTVVLPPLPRGVEAKAFGVTVEEGPGSETPTMPIVLAGS